MFVERNSTLNILFYIINNLNRLTIDLNFKNYIINKLFSLTFHFNKF